MYLPDKRHDCLEYNSVLEELSTTMPSPEICTLAAISMIIVIMFKWFVRQLDEPITCRADSVDKDHCLHNVKHSACTLSNIF